MELRVPALALGFFTTKPPRKLHRMCFKNLLFSLSKITWGGVTTAGSWPPPSNIRCPCRLWLLSEVLVAVCMCIPGSSVYVDRVEPFYTDSPAVHLPSLTIGHLLEGLLTVPCWFTTSP